MGCDIHSYAEVQQNGNWEKVGDVFPLDDWMSEMYKKTRGDRPFTVRSYRLFGWLEDVRNYSNSPVIAEPRGLPRDLSQVITQEAIEWGVDGHTHSYLTLAELLAADYEQEIWDRRITRQEAPNFYNGAALANEGEGEHLTLREFLGEWYFDVLEVLKTLGSPENVRIVFWFDN